MVYRCIVSLECIEQKVSLPFSASKDKINGTKEPISTTLGVVRAYIW